MILLVMASVLQYSQHEFGLFKSFALQADKNRIIESKLDRNRGKIKNEKISFEPPTKNNQLLSPGLVVSFYLAPCTRSNTGISWSGRFWKTRTGGPRRERY